MEVAIQAFCRRWKLDYAGLKIMRRVDVEMLGVVIRDFRPVLGGFNPPAVRVH